MKRYLALGFIALLGIGVYGAVLKGFKGNPELSDFRGKPEYSLRDRGRYLLTENLVKNQSFALSREQADFAAPDAGYYKGDWYLLYPPGHSILAVPFYMIGSKYNLSLVFTFAMGGLFAIACMWLVYLISVRVLNMSSWAGLVAAFIFGFGSISLGYATSLFQHHTTTFFLLSGFYAVYKYSRPGTWSYLWGVYVWLSYSYIIFLDYPNAIIMLPVIAYFLIVSVKAIQDNEKYKIKVRSAILVTSLVFIGLTALHGYYNHVHFGSWKSISGSLVGFREGVDKQIDLGIPESEITALGESKQPLGFFSENKIVNGISTVLFSSDRGMLVYNPIFLLGIIGIFFARKDMDTEKFILCLIVLTTVFFYASFGDPWGGFAFGPRYLIPAMAVLSIFCAYFMHRLNYNAFSRIVVYILFAFSFGVSLLGALTTNAVPPSVEAVHLNSLYGLQYNIRFFYEERTSSFAFQNYFADHVSLLGYSSIIFTVVCLVFLTLMLNRSGKTPKQSVTNGSIINFLK